MRYCKSTIFQANHNHYHGLLFFDNVVCDTAKVRFFKQITTLLLVRALARCCLRYCKSTIFQANHNALHYVFTLIEVVCDTAKVRFLKQITTRKLILVQKPSCLRYCKSTIFQANHNVLGRCRPCIPVVCDTAKVRFFKQITTITTASYSSIMLFAILQKYDFSSKSQPNISLTKDYISCLRYCKSTIFQANHNTMLNILDGYGWER